MERYKMAFPLVAFSISTSAPNYEGNLNLIMMARRSIMGQGLSWIDRHQVCLNRSITVLDQLILPRLLEMAIVKNLQNHV